MLNTTSKLLVIVVAGISYADQPCTTQVNPSRDSQDILERRQNIMAHKFLERVPESSKSKIIGEVPDKLLLKVQNDLEKRLGHSNIKLHQAREIIWPDGSMGCALPGTNYTQSPVNGYHVIFDVDGMLWDYRLNKSGGFTLCESSGF